MLGDSLRSLLIGRSQEEWNTVLPQIMRAYCSTPHSSTLETFNFLMLGRETRVLAPESNVHDYVDELVKRMRTAHEVLRERQWQVRSGDSDDPPLYKVGDWVWMTNHRRWRYSLADSGMTCRSQSGKPSRRTGRGYIRHCSMLTVSCQSSLGLDSKQ